MRKSSIAALKMLFAGLFLGIACLASAQNTVRGTPARDYLWPIPAADRLINENLTQNPGY